MKGEELRDALRRKHALWEFHAAYDRGSALPGLAREPVLRVVSYPMLTSETRRCLASEQHEG